MMKTRDTLFATLTFVGVLAGTHSIAQHSSQMEVPGIDEDIVPICAIYPGLCDTRPDFSAVLSENAETRGGEDRMPVPICQQYPELCHPGVPGNSDFGAFVVPRGYYANGSVDGSGLRDEVTEGGRPENFDALKGMIIVDPNRAYIRQGVIIIPQSIETLDVLRDGH